MERDTKQDKKRSALGLWLRWGLSAVILLGLGIAAWKYLNAEEIGNALSRFNWGYAAPIVLLSALYLLIKAVRFVVLARPLTDLPAGLIMRAYAAGQPATFAPGGIAARAALLAQAGLPPGRSGGPIVYSSLLDQLMFLLATLLAALWYPGAREVALASLAAVVALAALLAVPAVRHWVSGLFRRLLRRCGQEEQWDHFCEAVCGIHDARVLTVAVLWSAVAFISQVVLLQLCLLALHAEASFFAVLLASTLPTMAGRLTILPAGLGVTEAGMIGLLQGLAGVDPNTGAATAALYRVSDSLLQGLLGAVVYLFFWKGEREEQHAGDHKVKRGRDSQGEPAAQRKPVRPRKAVG